MSFDRNQYDSTPTKNLKEQDAAYQATVGGGDFEKISIEHGNNTIRIFPAHPGMASFMEQKTIHFLSCMVQSKDAAGNVVREVKKKPIFNAKVHGTTGRCVISEYIDYAFQQIKLESPDDATYKIKKEILIGKKGINASTTWACYAKKGTQRGECELKTSVKKLMNKISEMLDTPENPIVTDPFTHPDRGIPIIVGYNKDAKEPGDYYSCMLSPGGATRLSDEDLEWLSKQEPVTKKYKDVYKRSDLLYALDGLKRFDEENKFNYFSHTAWQDVVQQHLALYPEDASQPATQHVPQTPPPNQPVVNAQISQPVVNAQPVQPATETVIPLEQMSRDQLIIHIALNKLPITIVDAYSAPVLVALIRQEEALKTAQVQAEVKETASTETGSDKEAELAALRALLG